MPLRASDNGFYYDTEIDCYKIVDPDFSPIPLRCNKPKGHEGGCALDWELDDKRIKESE
jgi:hypothetical protein